MIGIDPGQTGALAVLVNGALVAIIDMPMHDGHVSGRRIFQWITMHDHFHAITPPDVWIEKVHSMPKQGVHSVFKFGETYGIAIGAAESTRASINYTRPQEWKKHFGLIGTDKTASLELARDLFPEHLDYFKRKKDNGRAEAALIALYGLEHTP